VRRDHLPAVAGVRPDVVDAFRAARLTACLQGQVANLPYHSTNVIQNQHKDRIWDLQKVNSGFMDS
jgi:hypothetical protein